MKDELEVILQALPWLMSLVTIKQIIMAGDKSRHAWAVGLCNQGLWLIWILATANWGFLPMNLALWVVYARNHLKWRRENVSV